MQKLFSLTASLLLLTACGPADLNAPIDSAPDMEPSAPAPSAEASPSPSSSLSSGPATKPDRASARAFITISCQRGNLPGQSVAILPLKAKLLLADNDYAEHFTARMMDNIKNDIEEDLQLEGQGGDDGYASIHLVTDGKVRAAILPDDARFALSAPLSNNEWARVDLQNGKTVKFNFVMSQAYCDKGRTMRAIDPSSYNIQVNGFSADYDDVRRVALGVEKLAYFRRNDGDKAFPAGELADETHHMVINNVQSHRRIKRVCGKSEDSLDVTIKADGALGVQTYEGTIGGKIIQCTEAWNTYYPFTYTRHRNKEVYPASEWYLRKVDSHNTRERSDCPYETLAKIQTPGTSYPQACLESSITHVNVFEAEQAKGVFPWGQLHKFSYRTDLTKGGAVNGKVPQTILP
ncbi:MAG: hypothetical protein V3U82_00085 [Robiginitomaculum sp.]